MHTNLSVRIRKIILGIMLVGIALLPHPIGINSITASQKVETPQSGSYVTANSLRLATEVLIRKHVISEPIAPPACSEVELHTLALPKSNSTKGRVLGGEYEDGCGVVSGVFTSTGLDRGVIDHPAITGVNWASPTRTYSKIYEGTTNSGVMPADNTPWPTWTDVVGDTYSNNPLIGSHMGVDGRTTRGTIDNYWVSYESTAPDPYITGGWPQHAWGDALGDYMYTSQSAFGNRDGETQFYTYDNSADPITCDVMSSNSLPDGTLGIKQFYQARGYAVGPCYNQPTNNAIAGGFSFAQFKAEIDSGWPVLLGVEGHTIVGFGYNTSSNLIYVYNGWDSDVHTMEWKENCYDPARNCSVSYKYQDPANDFDLPLQFVSIVKIVPGTPTYYTISGNVGTSSATITYTGGFTTADNNGNYSFTVTESWFGTVAVSSPCYTFNPTSRSYSNAIANQTSQNYTASINLRPGCANINVLIAGSNIGSYALSSGASTRQSYAGVNNGPVKIVSTNSARLIGAERIIYKVNNIPTSFSEMMGLPNSKLDHIYRMPWYNNVDLDTQLRFGNVSNTPATVHVWIGGQEKTIGCTTTPANVPYPYVLAVGASLRVSCPNVNSGPVQIVSNVNIVAAERVIYNVNGAPTSFTEMMGLPNNQVSTIYWLPWYNNVELDTQLRFGNVSDTQQATVRLYIGGQEKSSGCLPANEPYPYVLDPGESLRVSCPNVNNGPVQIVSNQNIVAAERVIYKVNNIPTSFSEMMALPDSQLSATYWLPWYNNVDLDTQLRFGNVSNTPATVHVWIGGQEKTSGCTTTPANVPYPYVLAVGASLRVSCPNVNSGPVQIVSNVNIVAAERVIYNVNGAPTSFTEMMGLPDSQLNTTYWMPWYNNVDLDTQLRFGVP